jgi:1-acyl-sn-glycerol-3-phosphate acyltransferase
MSEVYRIPVRVRVFRAISRPVFRGLFYVLGRVRITGLENVPRKDAYIIAINHISYYEAPFLVAFWPVAPEAMGASDIWKKTGQATLARWYGGIQVHRGEYDRQVFDDVAKVLKSGRPLLIAPEGGRSHTPGMRRAQPGIAFIIEKLNVPVLPVGLVGTTDDYMHRALHGERPTLEMHIGCMMHLPPVEGKGEERRAARQKNADLIMARIANLLPTEYRGVYGEYIESSQTT